MGCLTACASNPMTAVYNDDAKIASSKRYFQEGNQTTCIVLENGGAIACASMSYIEIMPAFSHPTGKRAHLMNVYTKEDYRRQGILIMKRL